ncbi:MAG: chemotaxis protein CheW [Burkholderiaceae bacterium]
MAAEPALVPRAQTTSPDLQAGRFGIRTDGLPLLLPQRVPIEFLVNVKVYPVPRAMPRLLGLTNLRGHAVPVFDMGSAAARPLPVIHSRNVLVLGEGTDALGLAGCQPPEALEPLRPAPPVAPAAWQAAVDSCWEEADCGRRWWSFDRDRLIDRLVTATALA